MSTKEQPAAGAEAAEQSPEAWEQYKREQHDALVAQARQRLDKMLAAERPPEFGEAVRDLLLVHGKTQKQVAQDPAVDIRPESFSRILNGRNSNPVARKTVDGVVAAIGCTAEEADLVYRSAGYVSAPVLEAFVGSRRAAGMMRMIAESSEAKRRALLKQMEGGKNNGAE